MGKIAFLSLALSGRVGRGAANPFAPSPADAIPQRAFIRQGRSSTSAESGEGPLVFRGDSRDGELFRSLGRDGGASSHQFVPALRSAFGPVKRVWREMVCAGEVDMESNLRFGSFEPGNYDSCRAMVKGQELGLKDPLKGLEGEGHMKNGMYFLVFILLCGAFLAPEGFTVEKGKEFQGIKEMNARELASATQAALDKKYPSETWESFKFPKFVYVNRAVTLGYKIAVKEPQLLAKFPCYCLCDVMGHKNLLYCFIEGGVAGAKFDDHASTCNICITQAMRGFLWKELGASEEEMQKAMKEIYE
jgi:Protein of unknown function with PCYCGC motif